MQLLSADQLQELEFLAMESMRGAPPNAHMAKGLERDITALLRRQYPSVRVIAELRDGGVHVQILLPRPGKRVERVVFRIGAR